MDSLAAYLNAPEPWRNILPGALAVTSVPGAREASKLLAVTAQFELSRDLPPDRYAPREGSTFCNIFASDWTLAMGAWVPHWVHYGTERATGTGRGHEQTANDMIDGMARGWWEWKECDEAVARMRSAMGWPVLVGWRNPRDDRPGHIAALMPSKGELMIAQAGAFCSALAPLVNGFGMRPVRFFVHA